MGLASGRAACPTRIRAMNQRLGLPTGLAALGVSASRLRSHHRRRAGRPLPQDQPAHRDGRRLPRRCWKRRCRQRPAAMGRSNADARIRPQAAPAAPSCTASTCASRSSAARRRDPRRLAAAPGAGLPRPGPVARRPGALRAAPSAPSAPTRTSAACRAIRTSRRCGAMPTRRPRSSPRPGIRTGASCRCRRRPRCCTATSFRRWAATRCSPTSTPPGTRCRRR